jgi:hypothetical protein
MTLSIKALLPEEPKPEVEETKKGKKGKAKEENADEIPDLREWKDDSEGGASIAEMLKNN